LIQKNVLSAVNVKNPVNSAQFTFNCVREERKN
jgi:hypothetical protein